MNMERLRGIENQFKSLETHFGLHCPKEVSKEYPTPSTIEFTM
jgi:hypothetical protein